MLLKLSSMLVAGTLIACSPAADAAPGGPGPAPRVAPEPRRLTFNGRAASARDLAVLARLEATWGVRVPDGDYWYDNVSGAGGYWGGPTRGFIGAGLGLGGTMPANASGGGTGVFINGREIHPLDVQGLTSLLGQAPWRGHWWIDAQGNWGADGGPVLGNLFVLVQQRQRASGSYYKSDIASGKSTFVGSGCAAVSGRLSPSDSDSSYSYYVGCE